MAVTAKRLGAPPGGSPHRRGLADSRLARGTLTLLTGMAILAIWELVARTTFPSYVARPSGIFPAIPRVITYTGSSSGLATTPAFYSDLIATCVAILEGMAIGTGAGAILGLVMGRVERVRWFFTIYVRVLYAMPLVALVPLITLWLGYGNGARLAVVIVATILPVTVTTSDGSQQTSREYLDVGRIFGAKPWQEWFGIALPAAVPYVMAGVQISMARAVTNVVAVEVLATVPGLGLSTFSQSSEFHENEAFVYVITLAAFAVGARKLILIARRRLAPWYVVS